MSKSIAFWMIIPTCCFLSGYLDIREGISSDGDAILSIDTSEEEPTLTSINQPVKGFSSSEGLYIHLTMLNEGRGVVKFVYGLLHRQKDLLNYGL